MKSTISLLLLFTYSLFSLEGLSQDLGEDSNDQTVKSLTEVYISGECIGPKARGTDYKEGQPQYCGYVVLDGEKINIDGRTWNCTKLYYDREEDGSCRPYGIRFKYVELNQFISEKCEATEKEGLLIKLGELKKYNATLNELCW